MIAGILVTKGSISEGVGQQVISYCLEVFLLINHNLKKNLCKPNFRKYSDKITELLINLLIQSHLSKYSYMKAGCGRTHL